MPRIDSPEMTWNRCKMTNDEIIRQALNNVWQNPRVYHTWKHAFDACRARGRRLVIFDGMLPWEVTRAENFALTLDDFKEARPTELAEKLMGEGTALEAQSSAFPVVRTTE